MSDPAAAAAPGRPGGIAPDSACSGRGRSSPRSNTPGASPPRFPVDPGPRSSISAAAAGFPAWCSPGPGPTPSGSCSTPAPGGSRSSTSAVPRARHRRTGSRRSRPGPRRPPAGPSLRAAFDLVVARSFGAPAVTAECAVGFLATGGHLAVSEPPEPEADRWPPEGLAAARVRPGARSAAARALRWR